MAKMIEIVILRKTGEDFKGGSCKIDVEGKQSAEIATDEELHKILSEVLSDAVDEVDAVGEESPEEPEAEAEEKEEEK